MYIEIRKYLKAHNLSPTQFGKAAMNDPMFIAELRAGRELRPATVAKLKAFMS